MVVLGSTGSIGRAVLDVARRYALPVEVLVAGKNVELLRAQAAEFKPTKVLAATDGESAILDVIADAKSDLVINAIVGSPGLKPTLKALECSKKLAIANKESLVIAGKFIAEMPAARQIRPIDSEHFGLWYLLRGRDLASVKRLVITASGGALRDYAISEIANAPLKAVLRHPNWQMGAKITTDSATMVNKLFEILEARHLFGASQIDAFLERNSAIHALVEFRDGSIAAQFAPNDMRLTIAFAILGDVAEPFAGRVDLTALGAGRFEEIDEARYPVWRLKNLLLEKPELGAILNAANEAAVEAFLARKAPFGAIALTILAAFERFSAPPATIEEALALHDEVLRWAQKSLRY
ncbi:MAG: 1-deoxy-D-xylulose-5-phosphate reductoisomerase [Helicobacteraceae bacterium]|jgi:1-deoxy-D-xylulose-5-phosphate reductoisomerase|nr:1-deoxy-D-xylulose-5-phosphate reductoisomerase [Helicobacteraceae bacterium]